MMIRLITINFFLSLFFSYSTLAAVYTVKEVEQKIESLGDTIEETDEKQKWEELLTKLNINVDRLAKQKEWQGLIKKATESSGLTLDSFGIDKLNEPLDTKAYQAILNRHTEVKAKLDGLKANYKKTEAQITTSEARINSIPAELGKLNADADVVDVASELEEIESQIAELTLKNKLAQSTNLELELEYLIKQVPILKKNLIVVSDGISKLEKTLGRWDKELSEASADVAFLIRGRAQVAIDKLKEDSPYRLLAEFNLNKVEAFSTNDSLNQSINLAKQELITITTTYKELINQKSYAEERLKLLKEANLSIDQDTGSLLRVQRAALPTEKNLQRDLFAVLKKISDNSLAKLQLNKDQALARNGAQSDYGIVKEEALQSPLSQKEINALLADNNLICHEINKKRSELDKIYSSKLINLKHMMASAKSYSNFLDSKLLWIASDKTLNGEDIVSEFGDVIEIFSIERLTDLGIQLKNSVLTTLPIWILGFLVVVGGFLFSRYFRKKAMEYHNKAANPFCLSFLPTLQGIGFELLVVLPLPLLLAFLGSRVSGFPSFSEGLYIGAAVYAVSGLGRRLTMKNGFVSSNFRFSEKHMILMNRVSNMVYFIFPPIAILSEMLINFEGYASTGRVFMILSLLFLSCVMHILLKPSKHLLTKGGAANFLSVTSYAFLVFFPIVLVIATVIGYFVSVVALWEQLIYSIRLILAVLLVTAILKRWLLVSKRKLISKRLRSEEDDDLGGNPEMAKSNTERIRVRDAAIASLDSQSAKLIKITAIVVVVFSLHAIWSPTSTALTVLDDVELWKVTSTAEAANSQSIDPTGSMGISSDSGSSETVTTSGSSTIPITVQDVLLTIIILFLTYIAAINIPSLLKFTVLNRLRINAGESFAFTTILRYMIVVIGIIWGLSNIGITWGKVQWLAAAITLGIGFGLQEIFANFVAGLIMLFERPVRIGDLVTIGDISGKVSRIQMRATTILQFNNRELIVPNKEFITGQLVNWTLSDTVMRLEIPVGIAYGSDTERAKKLLHECASQNTRVLQNQSADVIFNSFGASSLDFLLRVYVSKVEDLITAKSELHFAVDNAFREAGIEIAFPQQDIHIRSIDAAFPKSEASLSDPKPGNS